MSARRIVVWLVTWFIDATLTEATGIYHNIAGRRADKEATHGSNILRHV
jgi:hypothetical protein